VLAGRDNSETATGLWARRILTVLQFASAMALCAATLAVSWQTWYASHASPGFDTRQLLVSHLAWGTENQPSSYAFLEQLRRLPGIAGVATITEAVGHDGNKRMDMLTTKGGNQVTIESKGVSPNWFDVAGVHPLFGRFFHANLNPHDDKDSDGVVLNSSGALALGFKTPQEAVGQTLSDGIQVIGIAPDIRFQGLYAAPAPLMFRVRANVIVMIRTSATLEAAYRSIEPVWRRNFPNAILDIKTQQAVIADRYADDARLMRILAISSATALTLAAFGIYVLSAYSVQRSQREIVMRKLHGAGRRDIALMLMREFGLLVGAGAVIGLPPAAVATQRYLASYAEHAPIGGWTLLAALLLAILVTLLATTRHTWSAMHMPPVLALKD
jgi:putative ABC transport system permease protein